ncbi:MAG: endonuclease domain-containing protein [Desulfobacteraceae bacterium]|nr:endonuclease domain-containing protein [Desulfobacteraceae bacterium]
MAHNFTNLARTLRRRATDAEKLLWQRLRNRQLEGFKFRRQQTIGRYIVDFVNFEKRLVVELDGGQHAIEKDKDEKRDAWLKGEGYAVLRFWDNKVFENLEGILEVIRRSLLSPSPGPSHQGGAIWGRISAPG